MVVAQWRTYCVCVCIINSLFLKPPKEQKRAVSFILGQRTHLHNYIHIIYHNRVDWGMGTISNCSL